MGAEHSGAPAFTVSGSPSAIRGKTKKMRALSNQYAAIAKALSSLSTDGWTGRAAERFREKFSVEPGKWRQASSGFSSAAAALEAYATALEQAKKTAAECKEEYEEGNRVTKRAREEYEADIARGKRQKREWEAENGPGTFTLTIQPFSDPGEPIRKSAVANFKAAIRLLERQAEICAAAVRNSCAGAPEERNWFETGLAAVGEFFEGVGEAAWDLVMLPLRISFFFKAVDDIMSLASGESTPEEIAMKWQIMGEDFVDFCEAVKKDPTAVLKEIAKGMVDWDTWTDNPVKALGHVVPNAILAVTTLGVGPVAAKSMSFLRRFGKHADDAADVARAARGADDAVRVDKIKFPNGLHKAPAAFRKLEKSGMTREEWNAKVDRWADRLVEANPKLHRNGIVGTHRYTGEKYTPINQVMRGERRATPEILEYIHDTATGLKQFPRSTPKFLYRGTMLPKKVFKVIKRDRVFADPAFFSTTSIKKYAIEFSEKAAKNSTKRIPVRFEIPKGTAPNIAPFSAYHKQAEHLYPPGTKFKVIEIAAEKFKDLEDSRWWRKWRKGFVIELEE